MLGTPWSQSTTSRNSSTSAVSSPGSRVCFLGEVCGVSIDVTLSRKERRRRFVSTSRACSDWSILPRLVCCTGPRWSRKRAFARGRGNGADARRLTVSVTRHHRCAAMQARWRAQAEQGAALRVREAGTSVRGGARGSPDLGEEGRCVLHASSPPRAPPRLFWVVHLFIVCRMASGTPVFHLPMPGILSIRQPWFRRTCSWQFSSVQFATPGQG